MIQTKTVAFSIVAIVAVMAVFAATLVVGHEAQAFWGRGCGFGVGQNDNSQGNNNIQNSGRGQLDNPHGNQN